MLILENTLYHRDPRKDEVLAEVDTEDGPMVILRGGRTCRRTRVHDLLTGQHLPMAIPFDVEAEALRNVNVGVLPDKIEKSNLRGFILRERQTLQMLRWGDGWAVSGGDRSTCRGWFRNEEGQLFEQWFTPWLSPLQLEGGCYWRNASQMHNGRELVHLCIPEVIPLLMKVAHRGFLPSAAASMDVGLCEQEIQVYNLEMSNHQERITQLQQLVVGSETVIATLKAITLDLRQQLMKQAEQAEQAKQAEQVFQKEINKLKADLRVARSQVQGVDMSKL